MSSQAVAWALDARQTGPISPDVRLVLVALADYTNPEGRGAWPATSTLAERLGISTRAVKRSLAQLRDRGLIAPGDQDLVSHVPGNRRPTVYDVALNGIQIVIVATGETVDLAGEPYREEAHGVTAVSPLRGAPRGDGSVTPTPVDNSDRGDTHDAPGVTAVSPNPRTNPKTPTPLGLKGDREAREIATARPPRITTASAGGRGVTSRGTLNGPTCPSCGQTVLKTHTCRATALSEDSPLRAATPAMIARAHPVEAMSELPFEEHEPCLGCGTTSAQRPIIDDGLLLCARCVAAHYRDQERRRRATTTEETTA